jgi:hypothetical protein
VRRAAVLVLAVLLLAPPAAAADRRVDRLLERAEELRGLELTRSPVDRLLGQSGLEVRRVDRRALARLVRETTQRELTATYLRDYGDVLRLLGVLQRGQDLRGVVEAALTAQVLGLYDPEKDALFLISSGDLEASASVVVHELVHAIQDRHFDLERGRFAARPADSDGELAAHSLAEGDALEVQLRYVTGSGLGALLAELASELGQLAGAPREGAVLPSFLQRQLEFPYTQGYDFVAALRERGGREAVDRAFRSPPRTTLSVLDPDRYLAGDPPPVQVGLPPPGPGLRRSFATTFGAADLGALVDDMEIGRAWRGGRLALDRAGARIRLTVVIASTRPDATAAALRLALPPSARVAARGRTVSVTISG